MRRAQSLTANLRNKAKEIAKSSFILSSTSMTHSVLAVRLKRYTFSLSHQSYSSMTSKLKSALLSAPQTLHLFLFSLLVPNALLISRLDLRLGADPSESSPSEPSPLPIARLALSSSSNLSASISASGLSSIVSRELIDGERDRRLVGVDGMLEALVDKNE